MTHFLSSVKVERLLLCVCFRALTSQLELQTGKMKFINTNGLCREVKNHFANTDNFASLSHRTATVAQLVGDFYAEERWGGSNSKHNNEDRVKP